MAATFIDPGLLSARLDLERRVTASDGQGGVLPGYTPVASLWARIEPVSMAADERADETVSAVTHRISIRFRDDLLIGMRFRKGGRSFVVAAFFDPDETGRYLVCRCAEERS